MVALARFLESLSPFVPVEVLVVAVVALAGVGVPTWLRGVREKQVRERARRLVRAAPNEVAAITDDAVRIARGDAAMVRRFASEARRLGFPRAASRALAALGESASAPPDPVAADDAMAPWRAWAAIQELRREGAEDAAAARLAEARARWPSFAAWAEVVDDPAGRAL
jgi:hypothetical protein